MTSKGTMDLPDFASQQDVTNKDVISSTSADTGFGSDGTFDSPMSESVKELEEDLTDMAQEGDKPEEDEQPIEDSPASAPEENGYIDILGNGLLKRKVLVPGNGIETRPNNGDTITLKICGKLDDGRQIEDGEISFILNDGDVIVAFDLGVALMEIGEKSELITSPKYAYGELGREPDIPKDANITYILELIDVKAQVPISSLTFQERLHKGESKRLRGNYLFGRLDYSGAINSYNKAVKVLDDTDVNAGLDESDRAQLEDSWTKCYNNMAACQLKIDALAAAIRSAEKVLTSQPKNVKALYRIGKAYGGRGEVDLAITYLKKAIQLDPESKMLHQEMFTLTKRKNKETESERDLYRKMLGVKPGDKVSLTKKDKKNSTSFLKMAAMAGGMAAVVASVGFAWYRHS